MIISTVIIPYYQIQKGILHRALKSVLQQRLPPEVRLDVIVIDDGSPLPAQTEIKGLSFEPPFNLRVIEQSNNGVAAARNAGLQNVSQETSYIAFLDSDDMWEPEHIAIAISALERGFDYYFCDNRKNNNYDSYFQQTSFDRFLTEPDAHLIGNDLYEVDRKAFFNFSLRAWTSKIPTIVYRRSIAPKLVFNTSLRYAGEDCLFLFQLMEKCYRLCCSSQIRVICDYGVSIYSGKYGWNDPGHLIRIMATILMQYQLKKYLHLSPENNHFIKLSLKSFRRLFAFLTIRYFLKKRELWSKELVDMTHNDQKFWFWYPLNALYVAICFPLRLYFPVEKYGEKT